MKNKDIEYPNEICSLVEQYMAEAEKINQYISKLKDQLRCEKDIEKRNSLCRRIKLLETERFEVLQDIREMLS